MKIPRIILAAPRSGSGKTLITISLIKALLLESKRVAAFKCGPDYIDPIFHKKILGVPSKNLDLFFTDEETTKSIFLHNNESEISIIEGVMGLYDGIAGITDQASTYHLAKTLASPIILVIDAKGMGRSIIAELSGFLSMDDEHLIKALILNNMPESLFKSLSPLIKSHFPQLELLGFFPSQKDLLIESRYLGLKLPDEIDGIKQMALKAAEKLMQTVDLQKILEIAKSAGEISSSFEFPSKKTPCTRIAVAKDDAFCFYYQDNLELLESYGTELVDFSPVNDEQLPENISGLIFGGGYPEFFAEKLAANKKMLAQIKNLVQAGIPVHAECGGFMYLHRELMTADGKIHNLVGAIDGTCMHKSKLVRFGYIEIKEKLKNFTKNGKGSLKGHEFHYFDSTTNGTDCTAEKPVALKNWQCCHVLKNQFVGFPHLYYLSEPAFAENFVKKCIEWKSTEVKKKEL